MQKKKKNLCVSFCLCVFPLLVIIHKISLYNKTRNGNTFPQNSKKRTLSIWKSLTKPDTLNLSNIRRD